MREMWYRAETVKRNRHRHATRIRENFSMGTQIGRLLHICAERNIHCNRSVSGCVNPQASGEPGSGTVGGIALRSVVVLVGERAASSSLASLG
jgi:hypothetical protein